MMGSNSHYVGLVLGGVVLIFATGAFLWRQNKRMREQSWIDVEELKRRTEAQEDLLVMDVRTPEDFIGEQGHLAFARNLPLEELKGRIDELSDNTQRPIAIVCRTDRRSAKAEALLAKKGFTDVHVVRGGMTAWLERGWAVVRDV
jgi:rhodanese-related sulfurtransferase